MRFVACFRSLNLGHVGSPTREQLLDAFGEADDARPFQTNGTIVFDTERVERVVDAARQRLRDAGFTHHVETRGLPEIARIVGGTPPLEPGCDVYRVMISLFNPHTPLPDVDLPLRNRNGLVEVRSLEPGVARSACWKPRATAGDETGFLERLLGTPVTSRTIGTFTRLLTRFG